MPGYRGVASQYWGRLCIMNTVKPSKRLRHGDRRRHEPTALLDRAMRYVREGHTLAEAADRFSVPRSTLGRWCKRLGVHSGMPSVADEWAHINEMLYG
jgi:transposase-like protein